MSDRTDRVRQALAVVTAQRPLAVDTPPTVRIGLLGRGIGASLTPVMHETEGRRLGIAYRYDLIDFDQLGLEDADLPAMLDLMQRQGFRGANVTYPFKQTVLQHLDSLSSTAAAIGAVNTVVWQDGRSSGHNTDCSGFAESLREQLGMVKLGRVLQIGAGGAGAAVAQALAELGVGQLDIMDVDPARAEALAGRVAGANAIAARGVAPDALAEAIALADGVVNCSPVGMDKLPGTPFDPALLTPTQWVVDIIYFPRETRLVQEARARGCRVMPGGGMAVHQAVAAFNLFSGRAASATEMARTFAAHA